MAGILGSDLIGKPVITADGHDLGTLFQITVDVETGKLVDFVVEPESHSAEFDVDDAGRYSISAHRVQAMRDYILVE